MIRTPSQALDAARATQRNTPGYCQLQTRTWFNAPSAGDVDRDGDADAVDGWKREPEWARHYGDRNPPAGYPLSFSGGSKGFGHRSISTGNGSGTISTDMNGLSYRAGITSASSIEAIERSMGVRYLGWSETINGHPIPKDPKPVKPKDQFDMIFATNNVMSNPRNPKIKETVEASTAASVVGFQELDDKNFKQVAEAVPGYDLFDMPKNNTFSNGVMFRENSWKLIEGYYKKLYDGASGISYTRRLAVVRLRNKRIEKDIVFMSYHEVTRGEDVKRRKMRKSARKVLRTEIRKYKALGIPVVVLGDYNTTKTVHPTASLKAKNRIDHIYVFGSKKVAARKVVRTWRIKTRSDHDIFLAQIRFEVK